jgi:hypothetical protein
VVLFLSAASFVTYIILNNPSADDHEIASTLYRSVLKKYEWGDGLSFTPHPSKVFLSIRGSFAEEEKSLIRSEIRDLAKELNLDRKVVIDFEDD